MSKYVWYFAYGANLDLNEIKKRIGPVKTILRAQLPGYRLTFRGYSRRWDGAIADIEKAEGSIVYGVLYKISIEQLKKLDKYEGYPHKYIRKQVNVVTEDNSVITAVTYTQVLGKDVDKRFKPSKLYLNTIRKGLITHRYPLKLVNSYLKNAFQS